MLGLDVGDRRIGLAVSDPDGAFAFPAGCLARRDLRRDLAALRELIRERGITRVVVGHPLHMDGGAGAQADAAAAFAEALAKDSGLPVELLDERWTTREAERALRDAPRRHRRQRGATDEVAATLLLRTYLARASASSPA